ncbi:MAG: DUF1566 domain-containing protein [Chitinispirillaceae bacterium]|nr:DUF1566 domain-containing protein [Chitinispirillaceae bacterium]
MKKFPAIVLSILLFLCICSCILFIVVFITTRDVDLGAMMPRSLSRAKAAAGPENPIRIPDRFKPPVVESSIDSPAVATIAEPVSIAPHTPKYISKYRCRDKMDSDDMILLILGKNLFCKKSQWSRPWNNPGGRGIRSGADGLIFGDSVVADSFTNIMWQRYSTSPSLPYGQIDDAINRLNTRKWRGFYNWRPPTIEEIMVLLVPKRNRHGLFLPAGWNCNVKDIWSCNPACDSLSTQWIWVARMGMGRCNYGHPDIPRALLAVRKMR